MKQIVEEKDFGHFAEVCRIRNCMIILANGKAIFGYDVRFCKHYDEQSKTWNALIIVQRTRHAGYRNAYTKILKAFICTNEEGNAIYKKIKETEFRTKNHYLVHNITHIV